MSAIEPSKKRKLRKGRCLQEETEDNMEVQVSEWDRNRLSPTRSELSHKTIPQFPAKSRRHMDCCWEETESTSEEVKPAMTIWNANKEDSEKFWDTSDVPPFLLFDEEPKSYSYNNTLEEFMDDSTCDETAEIIVPSDVQDEQHLDNGHESIEDDFNSETTRKKMKIYEPEEEHNTNHVEDSSQSDESDNISWSPKEQTKVETRKSPNKTRTQAKVQYHHTDDGILLILDKDDTIHFHGILSLSVIHGEVEVLGHKLNENHKNINLYSPRGSSLLYIQNVTQTNINVCSLLQSMGINNNLKATTNGAVLLCKKLEEPKILYMERHVSQQILPKHDMYNMNLPRVSFELRGSWNLIKTNPEWVPIIDKIENSTRMMLCGGKGVGKSMLLRYMINRLLMRFDKVKVVDLDPGQSEFTPPGCISIVTIEKPLFGVNYTHLKSPDRSFLSNIDISYDPRKYLEGIKYLVNSSLEEIPTLINFMGFTHGMGINILSAAITCLQPTDILQINSEAPKKNYSYRLTPEVVTENAAFLLNFVQLNNTNVKFNLHEIHSMSDESGAWTAEPRQLREMCVLSYFGQAMHPHSLILASVSMYRLELSAKTITNLNGEVISPAVINANLVALCVPVEGRNDIFEYFGYGIVQGIDVDLNILVLITPEKQETVNKVTHLVLGSVRLPPSIYMTVDHDIERVPYVNERNLTSLGEITRRSRIPAKME